MIPLQNAVKKFKLNTVAADATAAEALVRLVEHDFIPLLVPRKDRSDAYGIVTKQDLMSKVVAAGRDPRKVKVADIMSKPLIIVNDLTMDLRWASRMMHRCRISTLAVLDKGEFYGFITDRCIIEEYFDELRRDKLDKSGEMLSC
jgi:signal-transduction protein with cAMP-binding, CBS, and nucleotidyltransferase domain